MNPRQYTFAGLRIIESNILPKVGRVSVRDIRLKDGTRLLSPEFLARENAWWKARFGEMEDSSTCYRVGDDLYASPAFVRRLQHKVAEQATASIEADIIAAAFGRTPDRNVADTVRDALRGRPDLEEPNAARMTGTTASASSAALTAEALRIDLEKLRAGYVRHQSSLFEQWLMAPRIPARFAPSPKRP